MTSAQSIKILNCLHRSDFGGAHRRIVWIHNILKNKNFLTMVLYPQDQTLTFEKFLNKNQVKYVRSYLPAIRKSLFQNLLFLLTLPISILLVVKIIKHNKIQIVHVNGATNIQPIFAALISKRPIIWHWNDTLTPKFFVKIISKLFVFRSISFVVATSYILSYYKLDNIPCEIIPAPYQGIGYEQVNSTQKFLKKKLARLINLKPDAKVMGFVSHLVLAKGGFEFIKAVSKILKENPENQELIAVLIGGTFPRHKNFANSIRKYIADEKLADRIFLLGYQENIIELIREFDVFIFSSHAEACPIVVLEAMQAGTPIVATRVGEVPHMLQGTGCILVPPLDVPALINGIYHLLNIPYDDKKEMALKMKANLKNYSIDRVADLHRKIYTSALH